MVRITVSKIVDVGSNPTIREGPQGSPNGMALVFDATRYGFESHPLEKFLKISLSLIGKALFFEIKDTGSIPVGIRGAVVQH